MASQIAKEFNIKVYNIDQYWSNGMADFPYAVAIKMVDFYKKKWVEIDENDKKPLLKTRENIQKTMCKLQSIYDEINKLETNRNWKN
jgi:hypothetical protein